MTEQEFMCPRRDGSVQLTPGPDRWLSDHWNDKPQLAYAEYEQGVRRNERWESRPFPWSWVPRACSYCGSVHPDDMLKLMREGWEDERSTKQYKGYLHAPGWSQAMDSAFNAMDRGVDPLTALGNRPSVPEPAPPCKFYTMHCTPQQLVELNNLSRAKRRR